jgi:hypothetical protein
MGYKVQTSVKNFQMTLEVRCTFLADHQNNPELASRCWVELPSCRQDHIQFTQSTTLIGRKMEGRQFCSLAGLENPNT